MRGRTVVADDEMRQAALDRLAAKRRFLHQVAVYVIVNVFLVLIWAASGRGDFWPIWSIAGWGIGLAFQAWSTYGSRPPTEEAIQREIKRSRPS